MIARIKEPDFIKGLAIILMVYGHISFIGNYTNIQKEVVGVIYTFHMPLFLVISGYFFKINNQSTLNTNVKKTFNFLAKPYLIFITLYLIGLILVHSLFSISTNNTPPSSVGAFFINVFFKPIGGYWFLHSLIVITLILYAVNSIYSHHKETFSFLLLSLVLFYISAQYFGIIAHRTYLYFILGYTLRLVVNNNIKVQLPVFLMSLVAVPIFYIFENETIKIFGFNQVLWNFLILYILWYFAFTFEKFLPVRIITWVGQNTLIILVLHAFFIVATKPLNNIFLKIDMTGILQSCIVTLFTVVGSLVSAYLFDKIGISKYVFSKNIYVNFK